MRCSSRFESGFCQVREMVSKKTLVQPQGKVVRREEMSRGIHRTTNVHGWSVPALPYMSLLAWASSSNRGISPSLTHPQAHPKKELQSGWRRNEGFIGRKVAAVSFAKVIFVRVYHNNWQVMLHYITLLCYLLYFAGKLRWQISSAKRLMCLVLCFTTTLLAPFLGVYARPGSIVSIPSYVQYEQLIKDIHGQDEKLAEVMLHFFIRQSFIPDYSCCHHQAWINRPKTSSFTSYFQTRHVHLQGIHHGPRFCPRFCCSDSYARQPTQQVWLALVWKLLYSRKQQKVSFYVWEQTKSSQSFLLTFSIDNTPLFILQAFQEDHELKIVFCCCDSGSTFTPLRCEAGFKWLNWEQLPMQMAVMTVSL